MLTLLLACSGPAPEDTDPVETDADTEVDTSGPQPTVILWAEDLESPTSLAWADWFSHRWSSEMHQWDERGVSVPSDALVVLLPDLPRDSANSVGKRVRGDAVLGIGLGGANAYEGLDNGLGIGNGGLGEVDKLLVDDKHRTNQIFAEVTIPEDAVLAITTEPVTDVGIEPADTLEVVAWDYRYPDGFADIAYSGRAWYWGWGDADEGGPDVHTDEGIAIFGAIVQGLVPRR